MLTAVFAIRLLIIVMHSIDCKMHLVKNGSFVFLHRHTEYRAQLSISDPDSAQTAVTTFLVVLNRVTSTVQLMHNRKP